MARGPVMSIEAMMSVGIATADIRPVSGTSMPPSGALTGLICSVLRRGFSSGVGNESRPAALAALSSRGRITVQGRRSTLVAQKRSWRNKHGHSAASAASKRCAVGMLAYRTDCPRAGGLSRQSRSACDRRVPAGWCRGYSCPLLLRKHAPVPRCHDCWSRTRLALPATSQ